MSEDERGESPLRFFILVFLLSVPFWLLAAAVGSGLPFGLPLSALMFPCPLLAASLLVHRSCGWLGVRGLLGRILDFRRIERKRWLLVAFLLMPAIYVLSFALQPGALLDIAVLPLVPVLFAVFFVTATFEEAGWTGYTTDPLQRRWRAVTAAIAIGVVWSAWHAVPDIQAGRSALFILGQRSFSVALRVLIVWIYNNAGRSVFSAIAVHAMDNVSVYSLFPDNEEYDPLITAAITAVAAMIAVALWGPRTLTRFRFSGSAA